MSEMNSSDKSQTQKNNRAAFKKKSTRVDLTPMVDLGFLLITFFIFTTAISQPTSMKLVLPGEPEDHRTWMPAKESGALTLLPADNDLVYYYEGSFKKEKLHSCRLTQIREVIMHKKHSVAEEDLFIVIKPSRATIYKDLVDILDEMTINDIKRYALVDITADEEQMMQNR